MTKVSSPPEIRVLNQPHVRVRRRQAPSMPRTGKDISRL